MTPWPILLAWLLASAAGLLFAVRLLLEARQDLLAAQRTVAAGLHPERIIPLGQAYISIKRLFVLAFAANVAAGVGSLLRDPIPEFMVIVVPFLIAANVLFAAAMFQLNRMRSSGLLAVAADLQDALQLDVIRGISQESNDMLHRMAGKDADVASALAATLEKTPRLDVITEVVTDNNDVLHRMEGTEGEGPASCRKEP
jgi:hypothetical protein